MLILFSIFLANQCNNYFCYSYDEVTNGLVGSLLIPDEVRIISNYSFAECTNLNGVLKLPKSLEVIDSYSFLNCRNLIGFLEIPETTTTIFEKAFSGCSKLLGDLILHKSIQIIHS